MRKVPRTSRDDTPLKVTVKVAVPVLSEALMSWTDSEGTDSSSVMVTLAVPPRPRTSAKGDSVEMVTLKVSLPSWI